MRKIPFFGISAVLIASWEYTTNALEYLNNRYDNKCYLDYYNYAHTIDKLFIGATNAQTQNLYWKICKRVVVSGIAQFQSNPLSIGRTHQSRLLGAQQYIILLSILLRPMLEEIEKVQAIFMDISRCI